ncbi:MAG TPA: sugar phosphate isomerase/epimerase [Clostridiaceae bacterium]
MSKSIIVAQLYTLRDFMKTPEDLSVTFKKVKEIGYNAVQVSGIGPIEDEFIKEVAKREDLNICATHIAYDRFSSDMEGVIKEHKLWNCEYVGIGAMPEVYRGSKEGFIKFAKEASDYGKILLENGLHLIYHNHNFEFKKFDGLTGLEILFQETDPRYFQFEIDTYWVQVGGGDPIAWIKKMKGRMDVVHFKDMVTSSNNTQIMAEVGEGNLNWEGIIGACDDIGAKWCAVEQDKCERDPFESLKISLQNLKKLGCKF